MSRLKKKIIKGDVIYFFRRQRTAKEISKLLFPSIRRRK
jgi:hypothetical protein